MGQFFQPMTIESDGEVDNDDPNVTVTYVKETEISGDMMTRTTETTTTTVNPDGTETIVVTEDVEVFMGGELTQVTSTVVSEETQPTTTEYIPVEGELDEPVSDTEGTTTVTEITTTVTETTGGVDEPDSGVDEPEDEVDEPESVGLTEEQAAAEAAAAEAAAAEAAAAEAAAAEAAAAEAAAAEAAADGATPEAEEEDCDDM